MTPDEIELYKDIAKIGIPALFGFLAGLIPHFLERSKLSENSRREKVEFQRKQVIELIEAFSRFSGNFRAYISLLYSKEHNSGEEFGEKLFSYAEKMFSHEVDLTRAKAISGLLGKTDLVKKLAEYDNQASILSSIVASEKREAKELARIELEKFKIIEGEVFNCLKSLA